MRHDVALDYYTRILGPKAVQYLTVHLITKMATKWLMDGQHIQPRYTGQGVSHILDRSESHTAQDSINLKLMSFSLEFST